MDLRINRRWTAAGSAALLAILLPPTARGEVREVTGSATMTVSEYNGMIEVQRDFNRDDVPDTTPTLPAIARSRLDHLAEGGDVTAAGLGIAMLQEPNLTGSGTPNDAGMDLAAFSDDQVTSWLVEGTVTERRSIILSTTEIGGNSVNGDRVRVESTVLLSGVMAITSMDPAKDLSGAEARIRLGVWQRQPGADPLQVLEGTALLAGGPDGDVTVAEASGALSGVSLPVIELPELGTDLPLVRAILFMGVELRYEYEVVVGEPFDLELTVESRVLTIPQGTGAAAVFGLPQEGLASVFERVKHDDRGERLQDAISERVDTTGAAYAPPPAAPLPPLLSLLFPLCGVMGFEGVVMLVAACGLTVWRRRSRCSPEPRHSCRARKTARPEGRGSGGRP
jgi:hypothetical protein